MSSSTHCRRGGILRGLAWVCAALGAAVLVTFLFATRGGDIQEKIGETSEKLKEKLPGLPDLPTALKKPEGGSQGSPAAGNAEPEKAAKPDKKPAGEKKPPPYTVKDPPPVARARHKVSKGETLYSLAETYYEDGSLWRLIAEANDLKDPAELREGMVVLIPGR